MQLDEFYMQEALRVALHAEGRTSPNPLVGAVIVRENRIVAAGWHRQAGTAHAEVHALQMAGELARGATLYVTLEPCAHYGHTGPCAKAVVEAGISRVVIALQDPNPLVAGKGIEILKKAGLEVTCGVLEAEARRQNEVFLKWMTEKMPFVILKMAMSLDGKVATCTGESQWITNSRARAAGHALRDKVDGIVVGINTVIQDNPSLTTRLQTGPGKNPVRIILDSLARTPLTSKFLHDQAAPVIIACTAKAPQEKLTALRKLGAEIVFAGEGPGVDLENLLGQLAGKNICSLLVEGGGTVNFSFLQAGLIDKVFAFIAPQIIGGNNAVNCVGGAGFAALADTVKLSDISTEMLDDNLCLTAYVRK